MPYINVKTNVTIDSADKLQQALGEAIRIIPGKTPERTMILIDDAQSIFFAGTDDPCAMVETQVNFGTDQSTTAEYAAKVIDLFAEELGIPENRIYVNVTQKDNWFAR